MKLLFVSESCPKSASRNDTLETEGSPRFQFAPILQYCCELGNHSPGQLGYNTICNMYTEHMCVCIQYIVLYIIIYMVYIQYIYIYTYTHICRAMYSNTIQYHAIYVHEHVLYMEA